MSIYRGRSASSRQESRLLQFRLRGHPPPARQDRRGEPLPATLNIPQLGRLFFPPALGFCGVRVEGRRGRRRHRRRRVRRERRELDRRRGIREMDLHRRGWHGNRLPMRLEHTHPSKLRVRPGLTSPRVRSVVSPVPARGSRIGFGACPRWGTAVTGGGGGTTGGKGGGGGVGGAITWGGGGAGIGGASGGGAGWLTFGFGGFSFLLRIPPGVGPPMRAPMGSIRYG